MSLAFAPIALVVGLLIGAVGVGGIGLPPALTWLMPVDPHTASGTSMWAFLFTGLVGTAMYAQQRVMPWRMVAYLAVGVCPAGMLGAIANGMLPEGVALLPLGLFTLTAGIYQLFFRSRRSATREHLPAAMAIAAGAVVGFCSALTGTGDRCFSSRFCWRWESPL